MRMSWRRWARPHIPINRNVSSGGMEARLKSSAAVFRTKWYLRDLKPSSGTRQWLFTLYFCSAAIYDASNLQANG